MELFSLLAKLTLDRTEYDREVSQAEGEHIELPDATLDLDSSEFDTGIDEANDAEVDDIDAELTLDNDDFNDGLADSESKAEGFGSSVGSIFENLGGVIAATGIAAAVTGIVNSLKEGIQLAGKNGDAIDKQSKAMHLSRNAYQELSYAMELSGGSVTDLTRAMRNFDQIKGGNVTDDQVAAFEALKISTDDATDAQDLLFKSLYALADYSGDDKGVIAKALFGNNYGKFESLFSAGADGIKEMQEEAHELGRVMTDEEIDNAVEYTDSMTRLNSAIEGLKTSFVSEIMPVITDAINGLAKIVAMFNWRSGDGNLSDVLDDIDKNGASALKTMEQDKAEADALIDKLAGMGDYWTLDDQGKMTWDKMASRLIELFPQLDEKINANKNCIHENTEEIKKNVAEWTKLDQQQALDNMLLEKRNAVMEQYEKAMDKESEADAKEIEAARYKADAIEQLNKLLPKSQKLTEDSSIEDILNAKDALYLMDSTNSEWTDMIDGMTADMEKPLAEAQKLRQEAADLYSKADDAMLHYKDYAQALADKYKLLIGDEDEATKGAEELKEAIDSIPDEKKIKYEIESTIPGMPSGGFAKGSWSIPNDMIATLHRGERVLTASQARHSGDSENTGAIVSAIQSLKTDMQNLRIMVGKKTFGKTVVDYSGNNLNDYIGQSSSRQESGYGT